MKPTHICLLLLSTFGLSSCDKIKQMVEDVSSKVGDELEERIEEGEGEGEGEAVKLTPLQMLVDQNEEGVVFRKDVPFPTDVSVLTRMRKKIDGRIFHESAINEKKIETVSGKESVDVEFLRKGSSVTYMIKEASFAIPAPDGAEEETQKIQNPFSQSAPITKSLTFTERAGVWKGNGKGDFKLMALSQQLSPVFNDLVIENALKPRTLWFSPKRMKIGDEITITDSVMPMVVAGKAKGSLKLKLESVEEVKGHPCGVFSVSGDFSRTGFPDLEGRLMDQEVSVESGQMWLSLIYPIILKEKMMTIQTFRPTEGGGVMGRGQGTIEYIVEREWKAPDPDVPEPEPDPIEGGEESEVEGETAPAPKD